MKPEQLSKIEIANTAKEKRLWTRTRLKVWMDQNSVYVPGEAVNEFHNIIDGNYMYKPENKKTNE